MERSRRSALAPIRVMIADDHPVIVEGITARLQQRTNMTIVGVVGSFQAAIDLAETMPADVILLDISGMGGSLLETVRHLRRRAPQLAIVIYSSFINLAPELVRAGVSGYVAKDEPMDLLVVAIEAAFCGDSYLSPSVQAYLDRAVNVQQTFHLSPKEVQVLKLLAYGVTTLEIAQQLDIDPRTVLNYISTLRQKTGCAERIELAAWYRRVYGDPSLT